MAGEVAGLLVERVTIERRIEARDDLGGSAAEWTQEAEVWAGVAPDGQGAVASGGAARDAGAARRRTAGRSRCGGGAAWAWTAVCGGEAGSFGCGVSMTIRG